MLKFIIVSKISSISNILIFINNSIRRLIIVIVVILLFLFVVLILNTYVLQFP